MEWTTATRTFLVLLCVFNPLVVLSNSFHTTANADAKDRFDAHHRPPYLATAVGAALVLIGSLYISSHALTVLRFRAEDIEIAGGIILFLCGLWNSLFFERHRSLFAQLLFQRSWSHSRVRLTLLPGIPAVAFLLAETGGSPTGISCILLAITTILYWLVIHQMSGYGSQAKYKLSMFMQIPQYVVMIVALDIILRSHVFQNNPAG